jgi:hypothetical protein
MWGRTYRLMGEQAIIGVVPLSGVAATLPAWSPDGRSVSFSGDSGLMVIDVATRSTRLLAPADRGLVSAWSADSRTVYWAQSVNGRFVINAVPAAGGPRRTLVYADAPERQGHRLGFTVANGRFYFTLSDRTADVWVAGVERK